MINDIYDLFENVPDFDVLFSPIKLRFNKNRNFNFVLLITLVVMKVTPKYAWLLLPIISLLSVLLASPIFMHTR